MNLGLGDLIRDYSLQITKGMVICSHDLGGLEETVQDLSKLIYMYEGFYSSEKGVIGFIYRGSLYVTLKTGFALNVLKGAGLKRKKFYIPFCSEDYPKDNKNRWEEIKMAAINLNARNFAEECMNYCSGKGVAKLRVELMANSLRIPEGGMKVLVGEKEVRFYPQIQKKVFDENVRAKLGTFNVINGVIVYVGHDGNTYIAKCYKLIALLEKAGFRRASMEVPMAHGGYITNTKLRDIWEEICHLGNELPAMPNLC